MGSTTEFQHSHEIAKLIGSPPGYLGHRETHALLSQEAVNQYHTDTTKLSFVLFDEIEKSSDALWNLLLGILEARGDRTQPLLPLQPGQLERRTHDYKRNGTTSLFAALELKTSRVMHKTAIIRKWLAKRPRFHAHFTPARDSTAQKMVAVPQRLYSPSRLAGWPGWAAMGGRTSA